MCSFHLLQTLAALLFPSNKNVDNKNIVKLVFVKWLRAAGSRKEQYCGLRNDSTSNQNFPVKFISVLKLDWLKQVGKLSFW